MNRRPCDCTLPKLVAFLLGIGLASGAAADIRVIEAPLRTPWPLVALILAALFGLGLIAWAVVRPLPPIDEDGPEQYGADDTRVPGPEER